MHVKPFLKKNRTSVEGPHCPDDLLLFENFVKMKKSLAYIVLWL